MSAKQRTIDWRPNSCQGAQRGGTDGLTHIERGRSRFATMKGTIVLIAKRGTLSVRLVAYMSRYILTRPAKRVGSVTSESVVAMAGRAGWQAPACLLQPA